MPISNPQRPPEANAVEQRVALTGRCALHQDRASVGFVQHRDYRYSGVCTTCARHASDHGYVIHYSAGSEDPS